MRATYVLQHHHSSDTGEISDSNSLHPRGMDLESILRMLGKGGGHVKENFQTMLKGSSGAGLSGTQKEKKKRALRKKKEVLTEEPIGEEEEGATQESQTVAPKFKTKLRPRKKKITPDNPVGEEESTEVADDSTPSRLAPDQLPTNASLVETPTVPDVGDNVIAGSVKKRK
ncbi:hypothetical protein Dimus_029230 [Dionaea muscipula]